MPRWKGPPLSEDPEFLNNFARGRQETLKSKMASEDMEDLQISDKTQSHALSPSSPIHNLRKTSSDGASISPRTIIESSDGSSRSGKKLGKEHWEHTKKWSREFLELYNAETDPEVKSIMRDMGKDLDKWITEKEVQDVADLMTRIPKRKRRFIEKKMDKLKREIETFGHQAVVSKYKEYLDENEDDYLWWLDLRFVLVRNDFFFSFVNLFCAHLGILDNTRLTFFLFEFFLVLICSFYIYFSFVFEVH